jgi:hypothetical protein
MYIPQRSTRLTPLNPFWFDEDIHRSILREIAPDEPICHTSAVDPAGRGGILGQIAARYPLFLISTLDTDFKHYLSYYVIAEGGVKIGFQFKDPISQRAELEPRNMNIQYLYRPKGSRANGLRALQDFLAFLEGLPDNPISRVYYRYGLIRGDLIGIPEIATVDSSRLDPIYERVFHRQRIAGTPYFELEYRPRAANLEPAIHNDPCN